MPWQPDYLTLAEAKAALRIPDVADDTELAVWITAASRAIDLHCNRQFGKLAAPAARVYQRPMVWDPVRYLWVMPVDDIADITGMTINTGSGAVAYAGSGATVGPVNAPADIEPWTELTWLDRPVIPYYGSPMPITVTAIWGWAAVPAGVAGACRLQLARFTARRNSPWGIAGSPEQGNEIRLLSKLDPDVITALRPYRRRRRVG